MHKTLSLHNYENCIVNLPNSILSKFGAPTTVAATTSVMSGLQPIEHAWLGWDCYYPQVDKRMQFEREFVEEFGKDFILLTKEDVYKEKLFGEGKPHKNVDEMIGDYVAIGITNLTIFNTREEAVAIRMIFDQYVNTDLGANGIAKYLENHGIHKIARQNGKNPLFDAALIRYGFS